MGFAEAGIGVGRHLRDDGYHPGEPGLDLFQRLYGFRVGTEGAANRESNSSIFQ